MNGNKRNFSLSIWDHKDNFLCNLKSANIDFDGQSYNENFTENVNGEKTLTFSIPMYIFEYNSEQEKGIYKQNDIWLQIYNEQKIRYIEYDLITNTPIKIEEFVLKEHTENRDGEQKVADCVCESLAVYELGKVGWGITFDTNYINLYESITTNPNYNELLTLDYWVKKIFYKETNLGRVSNTTECTYLLQGIQLRDDDGYPIDKEYITTSTGYKYQRINEPICTTTNSEEYQKYYNPTGWSWSIKAKFENDPDKQSCTTLYEAPTINQFNQVSRTQYIAQSYQKGINSNSTAPVQLRPHPIPENELNEWTYVTDIKKRLLSVERSNVYSIIQDLCEIFEVWADFNYEYDPISGKIIKRNINFKTESIDEDIKFDFAYGKNLKSCSRNYNSNELITKLYVTNAESQLVEGDILSIQESSANPTGETYIYNFDYFYKNGMLSTIEQFRKQGKNIVDSDEYKINAHCGILRNYNNRIINLQKYLAPLYTRKNELESELIVQQGAKTGYMDNIQSIQNKIDAIPANEQLIKSWSEDNNQYNHVGDLKTYSNTTDIQGTDWQYLNFGRDDIIIKDFSYYQYSSEDGSRSSSATSITSFIPRAFKYSQQWYAGNAYIDETNTQYFDVFTTTDARFQYVFSELGENHFIKGIKIQPNSTGINYGRVRYKYAPLAYYYLLIKDYWDKINEVQQKIDELKNQLDSINNKILAYDLELKNLLRDKRELILQFEKKYKPFIREGYWEPSDYQSQLSTETLYTNDQSVIADPYNGLESKNVYLKDLNLNNKDYTHYFILSNANQIDISTIEIKTTVSISGVATIVPWYRGNGFELFFNGTSILIAACSTLTDKYPNPQGTGLTFTLSYKKRDGTAVNQTKTWSKVNTNQTVTNYSIYIAKDNIITNKLELYGGQGTNNLLNVYEDYTYQYDSTAYTNNGTRIDPSQQESYNEDFSYKYSLKIDLKITNNIIDYINQGFTVVYSEETTLQYIYNDAVGMSKKYSTPQVQYNISVVDLSSLNGYENYKPKLGQKVPINDIEMGFNNFEGFITSIQYPLEEKYNTEITIATYTTQFEDVFQKLTATVSDISYNQNTLYKAVNAFEVDGTIKTNVFQKSLEENFNRIQLGTNNDITIDKETGITLKDVDSGNGVKLIGNGIFLTDDINKSADEVTWRTGITGEGINANAITAGNIDTKQINIWNASEQQVRFVWNDQGLFAYGDKFSLSTNGSVKSITTQQQLIDYNKFVKFNQNGLEFKENDRSALKLNWTGLNISAQDGALELNASDGLTLKDSTTTRLILGRMNGDNLIYGLRLKDPSGSTTFQTDSNGNLWLAQKINIGGTFNNTTNLPDSPNAGFIGVSTAADTEQMGIWRDSEGTVTWNSNPIRFWAGIQTTTEYLQNTQIEYNDINTSANKTKFKTLKKGSPALARFKVDSAGNIIASGIDVGGWIGAGKLLRSKNYEAILRSSGFTSETPNFPVLAIGNPGNDNSGKTHNFRVYQNGSINITASSTKTGNIFYTGIVSPSNSTDVVFYTGTKADPSQSEFRVLADGSINATKLRIDSSYVTDFNAKIKSATTNAINSATTASLVLTNQQIGLATETIGGYTNTTTGTNKGLTAKTGNYYVGIKLPSSNTDVVYYAGNNNTTLTNNAFYVRADGYVKATNLEIAGSSKAGGFTVSSDRLQFLSTSTDSTTTHHYRVTIAAVQKNSQSIIIGEYKQVNNANSSISTDVTPNFRVYGDGSLYAKAGQIAGWTINDSYIFKNVGNNRVGLRAPVDDNSVVFYAGGAYAGTTNNKFYVQHSGHLKATSADITGTITANSGSIGGFTIGTNLTTGSKASYNDSNSGIFIGSSGIGLGANFNVSSAGAITAKSGTIGGFTITGSELKTGSKASYNDSNSGVYLGSSGIGLGANFNVNSSGKVTAKDIDISGGTITIKSGNANKFTVGSTGNVFFAGTITATDLDGTTRTAINSASFRIQNTGTTYTYFRVARGLIVGIS